MPDREPGEDRVELDFDSRRPVAFGETIVLERRHARGFRAVAFSVPREPGSTFEIVDVRIGPRSQLRDAQGQVMARALSGHAADVLVRFDVCQPNQAFAIEARNTDPERRPRVFRATVIGALV